MTTTRQRISRLLWPVTLLGLLASSPIGRAESGAKVEPMALRGIMQEMSRDMQAISDAIAREAWGEIVRVTPQIADHPQPPFTEKLRILGFFAGQAGDFKKHDAETHRAAMDLQRAAAEQDGVAVITAYAALQRSCLDCHQAFRKRFTEHFYTRP